MPQEAVADGEYGSYGDYKEAHNIQEKIELALPRDRRGKRYAVALYEHEYKRFVRSFRKRNRGHKLRRFRDYH